MSVFTRSGGLSKAAGARIGDNPDIAAFVGLARQRLNMDMSYVGAFTMGRQAPGAEGAANDAWMPGANFSRQIGDGPAVGFPGAFPRTGAQGHGGPGMILDEDESYTFCCFTHDENAAAGQDGLSQMHVFARNVPAQLQASLRNQARLRALRERIEQVLHSRALTILYQPIFRLWKNEIIGFECQPRFPEPDGGRPESWFADAYEVGLGHRLEMATIALALRWLPHIPAPMDFWVKASPGLVMSGALAAGLAGVDLNRIVLQVTEHEAVSDYDALLAVLIPLRRRGMRLAVDDAGAGHATLRHILKLRPDIIKLDASLVRNLDRDSYKAAMTSALIKFALETGVAVVAKGIETLAEMNRLRDFGAHAGEGAYLGAATDLEQALTMAAGVQAERAAE